MESSIVNLSEAEQQLFGELFNYYDSEKNGIVSHSKAIQLLNSSQLSSQVLEQIIELSGSSRLQCLSRNQFNSILKLIGAAQSGLPLNNKTITSSSLTIPLPQLSHNNHSNKHQLMVNIDDNIKISVKSDSISHQMTGHLPPPPTKASVRSNRQWNNQFVKSDNFPNGQFITTPPNHLNCINNNNIDNNNHIINDQNERIDSRSSSNEELNDSPTDSVEKCYTKRDKSWSEFNEREKNEPINWADFDEEHHLLENEDEEEEEEDIERESSSDDECFNIWNIDSEQRCYYTNQFQTMQNDLNGKITGNTAKDFFEKSCLPIQELSKIWQLSDVDKDGALTLDEFCVAMHLVVLRRNRVELPNELPLTLRPVISPADNGISSLNSSKCNDLIINSEEPNNSISPQSQYNDLNERKGKEGDTLSPQNKQWTKFTDSPTSNMMTTTVSSPPSTSSSASGMQQLANFDFNAASIGRDPKILHPVALRLSPDGQTIRYDNNEIINKNHDLEIVNQLVSTTDSLRFSTISQFHGKKEPPPPPPPRPIRGHGHNRSSSLDLNKIVIHSAANDLISTQFPTHLKVSNSEYGLTEPLKEFPAISSLNSRNLGAFVAYKKTARHETSLITNSIVDSLTIKYKIPPEVPVPKNPNDSSELLQTVKALQDYSKTLVNINNNLLQELIKVTEDKNSLESQLEQLNNGLSLIHI